MNQAQIVVQNLTKTYRVPERPPGLAASLKGLVRRRWREVEAVREISFAVEAGERVGLIGPNGAGKTTTLKMLSGLLYPTAGEARVLGFVPWQRKHDYLRRISMVLGNKSQMMWDIPPLDTFAVLGEVYHVPQAEWRRTVDELVDLLEMQDLLTKPVRNLSLGERMKCELVAGLLHRPQVLFLDEPTLGLDVSMQARLRRFLAEYNRRSQVTVILTSHYMADVVALCPRVILIHQGRLLYDGELKGLAERLAPFKLVRVALSNGAAWEGAELPFGADLVERANGRLTLRVRRAQTPSVTAWLLNTLSVVDLSVEDPPIEAVIDQIYQKGEIGGEA
ncbi:MAG: ATP-binding cassette domain-containing protein [Anaerolineae bacterium]|nr:ATP-binding cassette domain-containing protein [Anaerolineae bacterium]